MFEMLRVQGASQFVCELLRSCLRRKLAGHARGVGVDDLKVASFVKQHVVQQETTHGPRRPLAKLWRTEFLRPLSAMQISTKAHSNRQCGSEVDVSPPARRHATQNLRVRAAQP